MNYEQMMAELQLEYLTSIPNKILDIEKHLHEKNRELLRDDFHKLKGTGKTYGIPEISTLGEIVEKLCLQNEPDPQLFVPKATALLNQIFTLRREKKALDIATDAKFVEITKLLKP